MGIIGSNILPFTLGGGVLGGVATLRSSFGAVPSGVDATLAYSAVASVSLVSSASGRATNSYAANAQTTLVTTKTAAGVAAKNGFGATTLISSFNAVGTTAAFAPSDISNLDLWLDASTGVTTSGVADVDEWADQSGNAHHVTPFTATKPVLNSSNANFNSQPTIDFADADDGLAGAFKVIGRSNLSYTLFMVARSTAPSADIPYFYEEYDASDLGTSIIDNVLSLTQTTDLLELRFQSGDLAVGPVVSGTNVMIIHQGGSYGPSLTGLVLALNGDESKGHTSGFDGTATSSDLADSTLIGGNHFGSAVRYFQGSIAEVIVYNKVLTKAEINNVSNYLGDKYGITITAIA